ncbi:hypothetical protein PB1_01745 [Bacillus methanolicus PB1]|uniref:Coat protein n=1 Tax=Bacillus methanolicus PB1 TaxID=997296 RepID=I3E553_BACMT|nr:hypothetical protein PB1_01745 [Bacillus methanolicus PB1]
MCFKNIIRKILFKFGKSNIGIISIILIDESLRSGLKLFLIVNQFFVFSYRIYMHMQLYEVNILVKKKLDPSVQKFKEFVQSNPKIILKVRKGEATWQELYEDWYLLGEDDPRWDSYRSEQTEQKESETEKKDDWKAQLIGLFKKMDANQIEKHIHNLSQALGAIQNVIGQFQESTKTKSTSEKVQPPHPFQFRKD